MEDGNMEQNGTWGDNQHRSQLNHWSPSNRNTDVPQPRLFQVNGIQQSTRYLSPGDFLRLQHVRLGYTVPNLGSKSTRLYLYAAAQNLLTFTKFRGLDPDSEFRPAEGAALGMVGYNLPASRTYTIGFDIEF